MSRQHVLEQLERSLQKHLDQKRVEPYDEYDHHALELTQAWTATGVRPSDVYDAVLQFVEEHQDVDFGVPGPLVHFVEPLIKTEPATYIEKLISSIERFPTPETIRMLNAVINGLSMYRTEWRAPQLLAVMERVRRNPRATQYAIEQAIRSLEYQYQTLGIAPALPS